MQQTAKSLCTNRSPLTIRICLRSKGTQLSLSEPENQRSNLENQYRPV